MDPCARIMNKRICLTHEEGRLSVAKQVVNHDILVTVLVQNRLLIPLALTQLPYLTLLSSDNKKWEARAFLSLALAWLQYQYQVTQ